MLGTGLLKGLRSVPEPGRSHVFAVLKGPQMPTPGSSRRKREPGIHLREETKPLRYKGLLERQIALMQGCKISEKIL